METLSTSLALCDGNPPVTDEFVLQRASDAKLWLWWDRRNMLYALDIQSGSCNINTERVHFIIYFFIVFFTQMKENKSYCQWIFHPMLAFNLQIQSNTFMHRDPVSR